MSTALADIGLVAHAAFHNAAAVALIFDGDGAHDMSELAVVSRQLAGDAGRNLMAAARTRLATLGDAPAEHPQASKERGLAAIMLIELLESRTDDLVMAKVAELLQSRVEFPRHQRTCLVELGLTAAEELDERAASAAYPARCAALAGLARILTTDLGAWLVTLALESSLNIEGRALAERLSSRPPRSRT